MSQTIPVPVEMVDKLASIARAMLVLTKELKERASQGETRPVTFPIPDLTPPKVISPEDAWFWSAEWQAGEQEVNEALKHGDYQTFESVEELIHDLHHHV
jgi:hypothetical protein